MCERATRCAVGGLMVLAALTVGLAPPAAAQQNGGHLTGRVTTENGARLPGIRVTVTSDGLRGGRTATTNGNGEFRLGFLPRGEHTVTFALEGFHSAQRKVTIREGETEELYVGLKLAMLKEDVTVRAQTPVIDVSADRGPPQVTVFQRPGSDGSLSLGIGIDGVAIDSLALVVQPKLRRALEAAAISPGWKYDPGTGVASGPIVDRFRLRLDGPGRLQLPGRLKLEAQLDDERVFSDKVAVEERPAIDLTAVPYLGLPEVIVPGETIVLTMPQDLDAVIRLDYGGDLGELDLTAVPGNPPVPLPEGFPNGGRVPLVGVVPYGDLPGLIRVTAVDGWDNQLFLYEWDPTVVQSGLGAPRPVITGASDLNFAGQQLCICGSFHDPGTLGDLQIGDRPLGPPIGFSPYVANFNTPRDLDPGPYEVGWRRGAGGDGGPFVTEVIEILAQINDEVIQRGGTTGLEMEIVGTDRPVSLELENRSPNKISMAPSDSIQTNSTGGPGRNHVPGIQVTGLKTGTYSIDWTVPAGVCPCTGTLPEIESEWKKLVDEMLAELIAAAEGTKVGGEGGPEDGVGVSEDGGCSGKLSLVDGRFQVELARPEGSEPPGGCELVGPNTALFTFLDEPSDPVLVKVLDGCDFDGHFWVFAGGLTDVEYTVTVTDTQTNSIQAYSSPLGMAAPAIVDTNAFATCP